MEQNKGFTGFKNGRIIGIIAAALAVLLLSGCGTGVSEINSQTPGFFNHYVVFPLSYLLVHIAGWFDGSFGMAVIILTLAVRLLLLPLMMRQARSQQAMKRVMSSMQPELDELKRKYEKKKDRDSQQAMQQEMMALYKKHKFNPLNMGCLPLLIQLPVLSGMYTAIRATPELAAHSFGWFQLGSPDPILAVLVAGIYLLQSKVAQMSMTPEQRKQFAIMGYLSPVMMAVFSFSAPAAMPLYWTVSGAFLLLQTLLFRKLYAEDTPEKAPGTSSKVNTAKS